MQWTNSLYERPKESTFVTEEEQVEEIIQSCTSDYAAYNPLCPSPKSEEQERIMNKKFDQFIYLDNNATAPVLKSVKEKINGVAEMVGNGSSDHEAGVKVRAYIEQARVNIANVLSVDPESLLFTASGSESNNTIIKGFALKHLNNGSAATTIITTPYEHKSILKSLEYLADKLDYEIKYLPLDKNGVVDVDYVRSWLTSSTKYEHDIALVSIMAANNETGVLNPVDKIMGWFKDLDEDIFTHTDACQLLGKEAMISLANIDAATFTAHKFGGPIGVSAMYLKDKESIDPLIHGGNQEFKMRAGTYNAPLIFGMSAAVLEINYDNIQDMLKKREYLESELKKNFNCKINGAGTLRLVNTTSVTFETKILAEKMVQKLSDIGIFVSTSSACNSREKKPSYVLKAMGLTDEEAYRTLRISSSPLTTYGQLNIFLAELAKIVN